MEQDNSYLVQEEIRRIRKKMFLTAYPLKTAHLASAFSIAEIMFVLYKKIMNINPNNINSYERDHFIMSKGHAALSQYVMLNEIGIVGDDLLKTFCLPGKSLGGEGNRYDCPGVETATGSLGHGLGFGVGQAIALKMNNSSSKVYVIVGNGEINEGVIWESVMAAYKFKLDNLVVILDDNKIQKMGPTSETMRIDSWYDKWAAFGWTVDEIKNGHDINEIESVLKKENQKDTPRVIIANTIKGKGVSIIENDASWHWRMPKKKELEVFKAELNITEEELEECKNRI